MENSCSMLSRGSNSDVIPLSIAPMMQWTDRHWRYFFRLISKKTLLYTEMIMDNALVHNPHTEYFLGHSMEEHPLAVQLGGNDPDKLGEAAAICERYYPFHEINLNSGCPSNKAKKAGFGAELMLEPELVRRIVYEMKRRVTSIPITVKCRLGVTGREGWNDLLDYIHAVRAGGVQRMIIHSRHCVLKGLSPAKNRVIPPLHYEWVHRLVGLFPDMQFVLNGGITSMEQYNEHMNTPYSFEDEILPPVHGIMIGREAYNNPYSFNLIDQTLFGVDAEGSAPPLHRGEILEKYLDYAVRMQSEGVHDSHTCTLLKPLHNFFTGCHGNFLYKQRLDLMTQQESKLIDSGKVALDEFVWRCVNDTMPKSVLWGHE